MKLWKVFLLGFLLSLALITCLVWVLAAYETKTWAVWNEDRRLSQEILFQVIRNAVTAGAALGVGITLFFSYRRQQTAEKTQLITAQAQTTSAAAQATAAEALVLSTKQHRLDQSRRDDAVVSELRSRYTKAAEQLGSDRRPVQIAGIYAMATLADDWYMASNVRDRQTCIDTLTGLHRLLDIDAKKNAENHEINVTREAIWQSISDRFKKGADNLWRGSQIKLVSATSTPPKIDGFEIDADINLSRSDWGMKTYTVTDVIFTTGKLDISYTSMNAIQFTGCKFNAGILNMEMLTVANSIEFVRCTFSGTEFDLFFVTSRKIVFLECTFDAQIGSYGQYQAFALLTMKKCIFNIDPFIRWVGPYPNVIHQRIIEDCEYGSGIAELEKIEPDPKLLREYQEFLLDPPDGSDAELETL